MVTSEYVILVWLPPNEEDRNGIIIGYVIHYVHFLTGESLSVQTHDTNMTISELQPHTLYTFSIAAVTAVGIGPFSQHLQIQTSEAGKC